MAIEANTLITLGYGGEQGGKLRDHAGYEQNDSSEREGIAVDHLRGGHNTDVLTVCGGGIERKADGENHRTGDQGREEGTQPTIMATTCWMAKGSALPSGGLPSGTNMLVCFMARWYHK